MPGQISKEQWKIIDLIERSTRYLKEKGIENPRTSTEILLGFVLNLKRIDLYLNFDKVLLETELLKFRKVIKRRANKEPVQYITGSTEFMSLPFNINPNVLIPRPETEILVENVINIAKERWKKEKIINILDIGTGSGNIAVSLAKYIENSEVITIDINEEILEVAKANAKFNSVSKKITFENLSIFDTSQNKFKNLHIIVSNPPYISSNEFPNLQDDVRLYEPEKSLHDYGDGLSFYKVICEKGKNWLTSNGMIFVEIGIGIGSIVFNLFKSYGFSDIKIIKDYQKIERVIYCERVN